MFAIVLSCTNSHLGHARNWRASVAHHVMQFLCFGYALHVVLLAKNMYPNPINLSAINSTNVALCAFQLFVK